MTDLSPISPEHQHADIGSTTFVISSDGTPLPFRPQEKRFLTAFDETHDLAKACERVGKSVDWGVAFFNRPKIHEWLTLIAAQAAVRNGLTQQWCMAEAMAIIQGHRIWWEGQCATCKVKAKSHLEPDDDKGVLSSKCLACGSPVLMNEVVEPVKKDRQQTAMLQEVMARVWPKVERISHEFSDENFIFKAQE